jgi:hypothetical protein
LKTNELSEILPFQNAYSKSIDRVVEKGGVIEERYIKT